MSELFSNIVEAVRDSFRHLGNANFETLLLIAGAIGLVVFLLFRK
jgi:hypothetical protein